MARNFSGTAQYLTLGNATPLELTGSLTVAFWIKTTSITASSNIINCYDVGATNKGWAAAGGTITSGKISMWASVRATWVTTNATYNDGNWHHFCGTASSAGWALFKDGGGDGSNINSSLSLASGVGKAIAGDRNGAALLTGDLAEMAVWSTVLPGSEITLLAAGHSPMLYHSDQLVAYWPLLGGNSPETDSWLNGLSATLVGSPVQSTHPTLKTEDLNRIWFPVQNIQTGAQALRGRQRPRPIQLPNDLAPITDANFGFRVPNIQVGPMCNRRPQRMFPRLFPNTPPASAMFRKTLSAIGTGTGKRQAQQS